MPTYKYICNKETPTFKNNGLLFIKATLLLIMASMGITSENVRGFELQDQYIPPP